MLDTSIYNLPAEKIDKSVLKAFLGQQAIDRLFLESGTLELKRQSSGANVVKAICGMANLNGGLVLVGVDENSPSKAPGVPLQTRDDVVNQCRSSLQPLFFPEIIPIPADDPGKVVLVIRVESAPHLQPVFCQGAVYVRTPGSTVKANRDHVIAMVHAGSQPATPISGQLAMLAAHTFQPDWPTSQADGAPPHPALRIRGAGTLMLRGGDAPKVLLRESLRAAIESAVDGSDVVAWGTGTADYSVNPWRVHLVRSDEWVQTRLLPRRWEPNPVSITVRVTSGPQRISWALDIDIDMTTHRDSDPNSTVRVLGLESAVQAWGLMADLVGRKIPRVVVDHLGRPALGAAEAALWLVSGQNDVKGALGLGHHHAAVNVRPRAMWQLLLTDQDLDETELALRQWLETELLDEALEGAEAIAVEALRRAAERQPSGPW